MDTRGLIFVTNDGEFANHIAHPSNHVVKTYVIKTGRDLTEEEIKDIEDGKNRGGGKQGAIAFYRVAKQKYKISLIEGAKRQIRNIFAKLDVKVNDLKRVSIGPVVMKDLPEGCYRPLTKKEIELLMK
jgi:23S rRNA pseudouridine2605 synthase